MKFSRIFLQRYDTFTVGLCGNVSCVPVSVLEPPAVLKGRDYKTTDCQTLGHTMSPLDETAKIKTL